MCIMYKCIHSHWCSVSDEFVQNVCMYVLYYCVYTSIVHIILYIIIVCSRYVCSHVPAKTLLAMTLSSFLPTDGLYSNPLSYHVQWMNFSPLWWNRLLALGESCMLFWSTPSEFVLRMSRER